MAIQKSRRIPALNPLRFIPANFTPGEGINTYPFDKGFAHQQIRTFYQDKRYYQQKVAGSDTVGIYVDSLAPNINISIISPQGEETLDMGAMPSPGGIAGNTDPDYGLPYTTYCKSFIPDDLPLPNGQYHVLLEHLYGGSVGHADNTFDVSECIFVATEGWEDTMLVRYTHNVSEFDVLFESVLPTSAFSLPPFYFRAEMVLFDPEHASNDTIWEDQLNVILQEQSIPFNLYELVVGGNGGVPAWVTDKMNRILACNEVYIDDRRFRKNSGANWSYKKTEGFPMRAASIMLREVDTSRNYVHSNVAESDAERRYRSGYSDAYV